MAQAAMLGKRCMFQVSQSHAIFRLFVSDNVNDWSSRSIVRRCDIPPRYGWEMYYRDLQGNTRDIISGDFYSNAEILLTAEFPDNVE